MKRLLFSTCAVFFLGSSLLPNQPFENEFLRLEKSIRTLRSQRAAVRAEHKKATTREQRARLAKEHNRLLRKEGDEKRRLTLLRGHLEQGDIAQANQTSEQFSRMRRNVEKKRAEKATGMMRSFVRKRRDAHEKHALAHGQIRKDVLSHQVELLKREGTDSADLEAMVYAIRQSPSYKMLFSLVFGCDYKLDVFKRPVFTVQTAHGERRISTEACVKHVVTMICEQYLSFYKQADLAHELDGKHHAQHERRKQAHVRAQRKLSEVLDRFEHIFLSMITRLEIMRVNPQLFGFSDRKCMSSQAMQCMKVGCAYTAFLHAQRGGYPSEDEVLHALSTLKGELEAIVSLKGVPYGASGDLEHHSADRMAYEGYCFLAYAGLDWFSWGMSDDISVYLSGKLLPDLTRRYAEKISRTAWQLRGRENLLLWGMQEEGTTLVQDIKRFVASLERVVPEFARTLGITGVDLTHIEGKRAFHNALLQRIVKWGKNIVYFNPDSSAFTVWRILLKNQDVLKEKEGILQAAYVLHLYALLVNMKHLLQNVKKFFGNKAFRESLQKKQRGFVRETFVHREPDVLKVPSSSLKQGGNLSHKVEEGVHRLTEMWRDMQANFAGKEGNVAHRVLEGAQAGDLGKAIEPLKELIANINAQLPKMTESIGLVQGSIKDFHMQFNAFAAQKIQHILHVSEAINTLLREVIAVLQSKLSAVQGVLDWLTTSGVAKLATGVGSYFFGSKIEALKKQLHQKSGDSRVHDALRAVKEALKKAHT